MKRFLSCFALASTFSIAALAHADTVSNFVYTGTALDLRATVPEPPNVAMANFEIDTTTGVALDSYFSGPFGGYFYGQAVAQQSLPTGTVIDFEYLNPDQRFQAFYFEVVLPATSLVNYGGGPLCSIDSPCPGYSTYGVSQFVYGVTEGQLTLGQSYVTPEPSSMTLLGTGVLGLIGVVRRRFA